MDWWQIVLILLASIVTGATIGALLGYLILRFVKKRSTAFLDTFFSRFARVREAPQTNVVSAGAGSEELYHGRVELQITSPTGFARVLGLQSHLKGVSDLRFVSIGGSAIGDSTIVVIADKPLPLASILNQMPMTKCVLQQESNIRVVLGAR